MKTIIYIICLICLVGCAQKTKESQCKLQNFLHALKMRESGGDWKAISSGGKGSYFGHYQIGNIALKDIGFYPIINRNKFVKNPHSFPPFVQEYTIVLLLQKNKQYLKEIISKYNNVIVGPYIITESGLLAAAHLHGAGSVKKWISSGRDPLDGNGIALTNYLIKFGGYNLECL